MSNRNKKDRKLSKYYQNNPPQNSISVMDYNNGYVFFILNRKNNNKEQEYLEKEIIKKLEEKITAKNTI
ncbi:MAG: hypothetical protein FWF38_06165 [Spirochaetaceae bacterium]|nr:hypothetical protein [Spirochaetaceae bacterium]